MLLEPILICKTFAPEALEVFYGENTFLLEPYESLRTVSELRTFLPHPNIRPLIKYLDLTFKSGTVGYCNLATMAAYLYDFEHLGFNGLKSVKVVINLNQIRDFQRPVNDVQIGNVNITSERLIWHVAGDTGEKDRSLRLLYSLLHPTLDNPEELNNGSTGIFLQR
jgi:hypothetical protein